MEVTKYIQNKIERKKFFKTVGFGIVSFAVLKTFPFNLLSRQKKLQSQKIKVKINPQAVQRKKGENDAG